MDREWGISFAMDLKHCNPAVMRSKQSIQDYVISLSKIIEIDRVGDCILVDESQGGLLLWQPLEGCVIWGRFLSDKNYMHIGLFTELGFDIISVSNYTFEFFGAKEISTHYSVKY